MVWGSVRVVRQIGLVLVVGLVVGGLAFAASPTVSAQTPHDVEVRDRLIADQEALLNTYRCMFGVDTQVVPGGCLDGSPVSPPQEPGPFSGTPTDQDVAVRNQLVAEQEALLNVYRCRFDIDTALVPGGCQDDGDTPEPEATAVPTPGTSAHLDRVPPDGISQSEDIEQREKLPPVMMPELTVKLTPGPNCSAYVHTLWWRNTIDYDKDLRNRTNIDYAEVFPDLRLGVYIRDTDGDDLTPVTQIPVEGQAKQVLLLPSDHSQGTFVQAIYNNAKSTNQRNADTKYDYLFSLINADDDLWEDIENNNKEFIFKVLGHYRRDNTYIDWEEQAKNHLDEDTRQYYQDLVGHQDHEDDLNAEKLRIFYDPNDPLDHLDFYNLNRSDCSKDTEDTSLLPDNWLEMSVADRVNLNPYKCSDISKIQDNGRCSSYEVPKKPSGRTTQIQLKISVEEVVSKDGESAEYRIKIDNPEGLDLSEVKIQYKVIWDGRQCNSGALWIPTRFGFYPSIDVLLDRWRDKPDYFLLTRAIVMNGYHPYLNEILCFKVSKFPDSKHTYIDAYEGIKVKSWRVVCHYIWGLIRVCF